MSENRKFGYIFPGQGAQSVGMGKDLWHKYDSVKSLFKEADEAAGFPLTEIFFEGPEEELRKTINTQPALVAVSLAYLQAARESAGDKLPPASFVAGHSLGEYSAMAAVGVIDFKTSIYLAKERGRLMYEAGLKAPGTMAAVMGIDEEVLLDICRDAGVIVANYNSPGQLIISGAVDNIEKASTLAREKGARVTPLAVSGAFHSPLMQPAVEGMKTILEKTEFKDPTVPVISNVTAQPLTAAGDFKDELLQQLTSGVQWQKSVAWMLAQGVNHFYEIGPGKVLSGLMRRIDKEVAVVNIGNLENVDALANG